MMAAQVGISALSGILGGGGGVQRYQAKAQAAQQRSQAYLNGIGEIKQLSKMLDVQGKQNESILKADNFNFVQTQYNTGLAQVQDALSRKAATRNSGLVRRMGTQQAGSTAANAAAAGAIGASVQAVAQDINRDTNQGLQDIESQRVLERDQFHQSVRSLYTNYSQSQQEIDDTLPDIPEDPRVFSGYTPPRVGIGQHIAGAVINTGMNYLNAQISLGLGSKPSHTPITWVAGSTRLVGYKF